MVDLHILLPRPCGEKWESMAEHGCNRHCHACNATIHDLAKLTISEVSALLDDRDKVCVRANVRHDDTVEFAGEGRAQKRIKALVGASLGLAIAACQTSAVTPLYVISGQADAGMPVTVKGDNGVVKSVRSDRHGRFKVSNLRSGNYVLTTWASCGGEELNVPGIQLGKSNVDTGTVEGGDGGCIVVGMIERALNPQG